MKYSLSISKEFTNTKIIVSDSISHFSLGICALPYLGSSSLDYSTGTFKNIIHYFAFVFLQGVKLKISTDNTTLKEVMK